MSCVLCHSDYSSSLAISRSLLQAVDVVAFLPPSTSVFGQEWGRGKCSGGKALLHRTQELRFRVIYRWLSKPPCTLGWPQVESFLCVLIWWYGTPQPHTPGCPQCFPWIHTRPSPPLWYAVTHLLAPNTFNSQARWRIPFAWTTACQLPGRASVSGFGSPHIQLWVLLFWGSGPSFLHEVSFALNEVLKWTLLLF